MWILWTILVTVSAILAVGLFVAWRYWLSIKVVRRDEVAIMLFFGEPQPVIYKSGPVFVPWVPIRWDKHYPWELVRIPTKQLPFNFEGKVEQRMWSKDRQMLLVDISGYVRFPFTEPGSLVLMIRSGVPTEETALQEWMEKEVVSGLRDIMAGFDHKEAIGRSNLTAIRLAVTDFFLQSTGLFARSGLCGNDPKNFTVGTGEVIIRIDTVNPTARLQKAMESPVVAAYEAEAAKETAKRQATEVGDPIKLAMSDWVASVVASQPGRTAEEVRAELVANGAYAKREQTIKDFILAQGGNLAVDRIEVGAPDGTPIAGDLGALAAVAALFGRGGGRSKGRNSGGGPSKGGGKKKKPEDMDDDEAMDSAFEED